MARQFDATARWAALFRCCVLLGLTAGLLLGEQRASAASGEGLIVFVGGGHLFTIRPDGQGLHRITRTSAQESYPSWSPDGSKIAFARAVSGINQIYVINADGSGLRRLFHSAKADASAPDWSPDGQNIVISMGDPHCTTTCGTRLGIVNSATGALVATTPAAQDTFDYPDWSPDGKRILFGSCGLAIADAHLKKLLKVLTDNCDFHHARWSPDGTKIAYENNYDIGIMLANGTHKKRLGKAADPGENSSPTWSPDGTRIAFAEQSNSGNTISIIKADGTGKRIVTDGDQPDWSR